MNFIKLLFIKKTKNWIQKPNKFCIFVDNCFLIWNEKNCGKFDEYLEKLNKLKPKKKLIRVYRFLIYC